VPVNDARRLTSARAIRGLADGLVSVLLADYLPRLGFSSFEVGAIVTGTLLGSAALTIAVGLGAHQVDQRRILLAASGLMLATGAGMAWFTGFWPLLAVAVVGTMNPSAGDVSVFLPVEQAALAATASGSARTLTFAWYNLAGAVAGAAGSLLGAVPAFLVPLGIPATGSERVSFLFYGLTAIAAARLYAGLAPSRPSAPSAPLAKSRRVVVELAALFSLDSFGGGFVVQSLLVLWLFRRFQLSTSTAAAIFFGTGLASAFSQLVSARIAARFGLVRTMVWTHLPSNAFLVLAGVMPTAPLAVAFLLLRSAVSQMDVPARQAYVMSLVPPEERAAAASVTNVPRSLAAAIPPLITGWMLDKTTFGWPLVIAGTLKAVYDLILLARFRHVTEVTGAPPH
jgi:MFS family permease